MNYLKNLIQINLKYKININYNINVKSSSYKFS